ncbi:hypothetical protein O3M35_010085 [Rhynocoris fuscipes]|uniref:Uncharacterized protein n=1 Tax=Rhynocoris fuscipes TaxID=488301 RepID=A0AAW1CZ29_9HEMI
MVSVAMKWFTPDKNKTASQAPTESLLRSLKRRSLRLKRTKPPPNLQEKRKSDMIMNVHLAFCDYCCNPCILLPCIKEVL